MAAIDEVEREVGELKTAVGTYKGRNEAKIAELNTEIETLKAAGADTARLEAIAADLDAVAKDLVPDVPATPVEPAPADPQA